jgi:hypothetical protein
MRILANRCVLCGRPTDAHCAYCDRPICTHCRLRHRGKSYCSPAHRDNDSLLGRILRPFERSLSR